MGIRNRKIRIILSIIGVVLSTALLVISAVLAENDVISSALANVLIAVSTVLVIVAVVFAARVDYETGEYECRNCAHTFKPTFSAYVWGAHTLTTRHLKCPECKEKTWCRRKPVK